MHGTSARDISLRLGGLEAQMRLADVNKARKKLKEASDHFETTMLALGAVLREADAMSETLRIDSTPSPSLLEQTRQLRREVYRMLATAVPEQAWFWTEEWQAKERQADADLAAGNVH